MDLYKEWDNLNKTKFNTTLAQKEIMEAITHESQLSLAILKKGLKVKMYWALFFITTLVVWILLSLNSPELLMILAALAITNLAFLIPIIINYKKMQINSVLLLNTAQSIKKNVVIIKNVLRLQFIIGVFAMPVSVILGILLSNYYRGHSIMDVLHTPDTLMVMIISLVIIVPLAIISSMKMNAVAFGKYLHNLQENATQLETLN